MICSPKTVGSFEVRRRASASALVSGEGQYSNSRELTLIYLFIHSLFIHSSYSLAYIRVRVITA